MLQSPIHNAFKADVLDLAPMIIAVHDTDYNIVWANKAYQKATGLSLKEVKGKKCFSVWRLARPCNGCPVLTAIETGKQQEAELTPENQDHWPATKGSWLSKAVPIRDAEGNIIGAVETAYDITGRKQFEKMLQESEREKAAILDAISELVAYQDLNHTVLWTNKAAAASVDQKQENLVGRKCYEIWANRKEECEKCPVAKAIETGGMHQNTITTPDERVWIVTGYPIKDKKGKITGAVEVTTDITEHKRTVKALRESETKYRTILETTSEGCWILNPELETIEINESLCKMLGYNRDEILGKTPFEFVNGENRKIFIGQTSKISTIPHRSYEITLKKKNGEDIHTFFNATTIRDESGVVLGSFAFITDITERKRAEKALRESEIKYRFLTENIADIIWTLDLNLKTTYVSPSVKSILGFTSEERLKQKIEDMITPESLKKIQAIFIEELQREKESINDVDRFITIEVEYYHKNGSVIWMETSVKWIRDPSGTITGVLGVSRDITRQKIAENALRENEERYRSMMEAMTDPVYICSHDFRIEYMNPAMIEKVGHDGTGEICHKTIFDEDEQFPWCVFDQIWQGKHVRYEKKDPKTGLFYSINSSPVARSDAPASKFSIFRDITEIKMMEEERIAAEAKLQQALKMESIGTLAGGIAHDFNNILSSVIGYTELSLDEVEGNTILEENLKEVYTAGMWAKDLVKQILTFARQSDEEIKPVQVDIIVKEALKFLRSSIPTTIEIRQNIESDSLIMGDPTQIHQILMNLCTNAAQAIDGKGGVLNVDLTDVCLDADFTKSYEDLKPGDYLKLSVSDTGSGIKPENIESIFEPYFTTKAPGEGTGMGLSTAHGIVKQYGGEIMVDSEVNKGSTFSVYLPITKKRTKEKSYQAEDLPSGNESILVIDDEASIAKMSSQILERLGYSVTTRVSSLEALELFRAKPNDFDLVITDMTMPNMPGDKLATELIKIRPDIPVILCTGYSKKISDNTAKEIGIKAFACKPIVKADLARTVRKVPDAGRSEA